ncbi:MAG: transglycosylase domain-containing protein [Alphaproteobacteria bacterium]|nr:transglycosylase domain-containing protein [Alphaproteobacteria bacterium]
MKHLRTYQKYIHHLYRHTRSQTQAYSLVEWGMLVATLFFFASAIVLLFLTLSPLPTIDLLGSRNELQSIHLLDRNDKELFNYSADIQREYTPIGSISKNIINAAIAIEDKDFYQHKGFKPLSFARALFINATNFGFVQGGSTITQQVVKNVFLTKDKSVLRKAREIILSYRLEKNIDKNKILEIYFNTISYGGVIYGVKQASQDFFKKDATNVTIAEAAYLAAIPNAPSYYSPYGKNFNALEKRKNIILFKMFQQGFITEKEYRNAEQERVSFYGSKKTSIFAPHFVFFVRELLEKEYGSIEALTGKKIKTTLDYNLQLYVQQQIERFLEGKDETQNLKNISAVILDSQTADVLAMVGSANYFNKEIQGQVNIANSLRQPGSTLKPFIYAAAFEKGYTPQTIEFDVPTQFGTNCEPENLATDLEKGCYAPTNFGNLFRGPINFTNALAQSINIIAIKVMYLVSTETVVTKLKQLLITSIKDDSCGLGLAIGCAEVTPLELAQAYTALANDGIVKQFRVFYEDEVDEGTRVFEEDAVQKVNSILTNETARRPILSVYSNMGREIAIKTGTTNNIKDIWTVGYTPRYIIVLWGGNSDATPLHESAAGSVLLPLLRPLSDYMTEKFDQEKIAFSTSTIPLPANPHLLGKWWSEDGAPHSILHFVKKKNPKEPGTSTDDSQYNNWEYAITRWANNNTGTISFLKKTIGIENKSGDSIVAPLVLDPYIFSPRAGVSIYRNNQLLIQIANPPQDQAASFEYYMNGNHIGTSRQPVITVTPRDVINDNSQSITLTVIIRTKIKNITLREKYPLL